MLLRRFKCWVHLRIQSSYKYIKELKGTMLKVLKEGIMTQVPHRILVKRQIMKLKILELSLEHLE